MSLPVTVEEMGVIELVEGVGALAVGENPSDEEVPPSDGEVPLLWDDAEPGTPKIVEQLLRLRTDTIERVVALATAHVKRIKKEEKKKEKEEEKEKEKEKKKELVCKFCETKLYSQYKDLGYCAKCTKAQAKAGEPFYTVDKGAAGK